MQWIDRIKMWTAVWVIGIAAASVSMIAWAGLPLLPVVGVAVAAFVVSFNKTANRLDRPTCLSCGYDLSGEPVGDHGAACPTCGAVNPRRPLV
ncbi:MAG: hypothetical protein JNM07_08540 [Phycisphaerae bacterium]|nr:hypothetical protein [Phycisphaerae bacterium]